MNNFEIEIIAEIGINHNGSIQEALRLIDSAFLAGVHSVKFQYRNLSRVYGVNADEIGDLILKTELQRVDIKASEIIELSKYAKQKGLNVGISFFIAEDVSDFNDYIDGFDFFKIPSPELKNKKLIRKLLGLNKPVYISTGAHSESDIDVALGTLEAENWFPFHCVSNYPVELFNSSLGYLYFLQNKWGRCVGYSSHDANWENCIAALTFGVRWIERHITLNKQADGLDHSTSSTPEEFSRLVIFARYINDALRGNAPRKPNQGELMNLQNLGRSFHFNKSQLAGSLLVESDLDYISPSTGIGMDEIENYLGKNLESSVVKGDPVSRFIFNKSVRLSGRVVDYLNENLITLPARFHDIGKLRSTFGLTNFELHLSYSELLKKFDFGLFDKNERYSIHLPDYISSTHLIDPFSKDNSISLQSHTILKNAAELAKYLSNLTGNRVPLVSSLSKNKVKSVFYDKCKELTEKYTNEDHYMTMQILPPFAWYFGGSTPIDVFSSPEEWDSICSYKLPITLDLSHLIMSCNYHNFPILSAVDRLRPFALHYHLSLAEGIDGEGTNFDGIPDILKPIISEQLKAPYMKVIEVWQGHLNGFEGFRKACLDLYNVANE